jgi:predicted TIM-barrel fold metal-dependent hydrolase
VSGSWDCHAHVFGPYGRYPLAAERSYTPPEAPAAEYLALLDRLGMAHGVLVHPSAYGEDHSLLLDVLAANPQLRGVMVLRAADRMTLAELRAKGVRGLRFSHRGGAGTNFAGSASLDDLATLAPAMAEAGLHAELWTDTGALPALEPLLRTLAVPAVIDHMGGFDPAAGVDAPGFRALLRLLESGRVWVKLCAYRNLLASGDLDAGEPFQRALQQANPGQLVWGSDWPHLRVAPAPDAARLLDAMRRWAGDESLAQRILVDNAARLYA